MESQLEHYILFPSYTSGLALEKLLKQEKIKYTIVPTPRELTVSCGICIRFNKEDEERIVRIIEENSITTKGIHSLEKKYKRFYG